MKFFFTFRKSKTPPSTEHYVAVNAPCESTAIDKLIAADMRNWSSITTTSRFLIRAGKKLWREL